MASLTFPIAHPDLPRYGCAAGGDTVLVLQPARVAPALFIEPLGCTPERKSFVQIGAACQGLDAPITLNPSVVPLNLHVVLRRGPT